MSSGFATAGARQLDAPAAAPAAALAATQAANARLLAARLHLTRAAQVAKTVAAQYAALTALVGVTRAAEMVAQASSYLRRAQAEYDRALTAVTAAVKGR